MATIEDDLKSFTRFVYQRMETSDEMKLSELFELWALEHSHDSS